MNADYPATAGRAEHRCEYCRAPEAAFNFPFEVEHIHPSSAGGPGATANLALGCRLCNLFKSAATTAADPGTGEIVPLFHPRTDRWEEHFRVQPGGTIVGNTAIGRATIEKLRMNSPRQLAARQLWRTLRIFPGGIHR